MRCDRIWRNARLATMVGRHGLGLVDDGLIACGGGKILFAGPESAAPRDLEAPEAIDCRGRLITPGLIDCHTHLVYAGNRAQEFEQRLNGVSYEEIARQGGGMLFLSRFVPVISFNLINYAAGLTAISWWTFTWATGLGILPLTFLMVLTGDGLWSGQAPAWLWLVAAAIAGVLVWWALTRYRAA